MIFSENFDYPVYTASVVHSALAAEKNLLILTAASGVTISILQVSITNQSQETNEQLTAGLFVATGAGTGAATAITTLPCRVGGQASRSNCVHTYVTTEPTLPAVAYYTFGFPSLNGYFWTPPKNGYLTLDAGGILVVRLMTAAFFPLDCRAEITWAEK